MPAGEENNFETYATVQNTIIIKAIKGDFFD